MSVTTISETHHHHDHHHHAHAHGPRGPPRGPGSTPRAAEVAPGPSEAGSVVLDIGAGAGAAVVRTDADMCGLELEIRRAGEDWDGRHMAVRRREGAGTTQFAAVFGGLAAGRYELRVRGMRPGEAALVMDVVDASVRVGDWPTADAAD
jgi:hypothetical protein